MWHRSCNTLIRLSWASCGWLLRPWQMLLKVAPDILRFWMKSASVKSFRSQSHHSWLWFLIQTHHWTKAAAIAAMIKNHHHLLTNSLASTARQQVNETLNVDFSGLHAYFHTTECCMWRMMRYWGFFAHFRNMTSSHWNLIIDTFF